MVAINKTLRNKVVAAAMAVSAAIIPTAANAQNSLANANENRNTIAVASENRQDQNQISNNANANANENHNSANGGNAVSASAAESKSDSNSEVNGSGNSTNDNKSSASVTQRRNRTLTVPLVVDVTSIPHLVFPNQNVVGERCIDGESYIVTQGDAPLGNNSAEAIPVKVEYSKAAKKRMKAAGTYKDLKGVAAPCAPNFTQPATPAPVVVQEVVKETTVIREVAAAPAPKAEPKPQPKPVRKQVRKPAPKAKAPKVC